MFHIWPPSGVTIRDRAKLLTDELWPSVRRCQMWNFGVDTFNNKYARVKIRIFRILSLVFERFRFFEIFSFFHRPGKIPRRMALEPCLYDLPSLRKENKKNNFSAMCTWYVDAANSELVQITLPPTYLDILFFIFYLAAKLLEIEYQCSLVSCGE